MGYDAVLKCGYCGTETKLEDAAVTKALNKDRLPACPCGQHSYGTTMTAKMNISPAHWKGWTLGGLKAS